MVNRTPDQDHRIRNSALLFTAVALAFYFGYIALAVYRSRH